MSRPRHQIRLSELASRKPTPFEIVPDQADCAALADSLDLVEIKKLRFDGQIAPQGQRDWVLTAKLGATVVQTCVVTLAPVQTRIDEDITRSFLADYVMPDGAEVEMPEDDTQEPIPAVFDLAHMMTEALSLALPAFPRANGASLGEAVYAADGVTPMTDEDAKPFAGLGALKQQLENKDS